MLPYCVGKKNPRTEAFAAERNTLVLIVVGHVDGGRLLSHSAEIVYASRNLYLLRRIPSYGHIGFKRIGVFGCGDGRIAPVLPSGICDYCQPVFSPPCEVAVHTPREQAVASIVVFPCHVGREVCHNGTSTDAESCSSVPTIVIAIVSVRLHYILFLIAQISFNHIRGDVVSDKSLQTQASYYIDVVCKGEIVGLHGAQVDIAFNLLPRVNGRGDRSQLNGCWELVAKRVGNTGCLRSGQPESHCR